METVYQEFPDDLDIATLFADALMNLTPWKLWDLRSGQPAPEARTLEVKKTFERALIQENALQHPGLVTYVYSPYGDVWLPGDCTARD
ncbi:hypothetical protein V1517DRAFT_341321 [Lipomyces orientalis]|uniref:Uncharacterized protein n=1 Tax=Lipomyces orientalis TaxID=1233043 RepID=A0ACC3TI96_9ASCO